MASAMLRSASALVSRPCAPRVAFRPALAPQRMPVVQRGALQVVAAEEKKNNKKRTPQPVKRAQLAEERRMYNKARKSAITTRIRKIIRFAEEVISPPVKGAGPRTSTVEEDVKTIEKLVAEADSEIGKAVSKGILHPNTGARRKARCARYKKTVLMALGAWQPPADHPDYQKYLQLQAKAESRASKAASA